MRYIYDIRFFGTVNSVPEMDSVAPPETIDDIRGVVLESFRPDPQVGVVVEFTSVSIHAVPDLEIDKS